MKIVIIMPSLCMCGAERVAVSLANWLAKYNEVHLISLTDEKSSYFIEEKVNVYYKNYDSNKIVGNKIIKTFKKIKLKLKYVMDILKKIQPDIIYEMLYYPMIYAIIYKVFINRKTVIIGSERNNPQMNEGFIKKFLSWFCPKVSNGYIFQTERVKSMFSKSIQKKSIVIPNAISNMNINIVQEIDKKEKIICNMGKLKIQKGQDLLIKAFKIVHDKYNDYKLVIYGEGEERKKLEDLVQELNLEKHVFLPGKDEKAICKVNESEIFVFSSRFEGMPNALMEAMAIGMPCIATDCIAGPSELIENNEDGILVEMNNIEQLAEKIIYLIENKDVAKEMGKKAKNKMKDKFNIDYIYNIYYKYFLKVFNDKVKQ